MKNLILYYLTGLTAPLNNRRFLYSCTRILIASFLMAAAGTGPLFSQSGIQYQVAVEGLADQNVLKLFESVSETINQKDHPPLSRGLLIRRVDDDIPLLMKVLRAQAYYGADIETRIDFESDPARVVFQINPGRPYILETVDMEVTGPAQKDKVDLPDLKELELQIGEPALSKPIIDAGGIMARHFSSRGFPFPKVEQPGVIVDHLSKTVRVTYSIDPGPFGVFGPVEIEGLESVDGVFIKRQMSWKQGDIFDEDRLQKTKIKLLETGLFSLVRVTTADSLDEAGQLPVFVQVKERAHRTLKTGLGYKTDEGPGGKISWEHRNIFNNGETLNFTALGSGIAYALTGSYKEPEFRRIDQTLLLDMRLADDHPEAYESKNITALLRIKQILRRGMDITPGIGLRYSNILQSGEENTFQLLYLPVDFNWDRSDDLFDPSKGGRLALNLSPYYDVTGRDVSFARALGSYSHYLRLSSNPLSILAIRGGVGIMTGSERDDIPADIRFYAGGGGTIRGYAFQSVGPSSDNGEPLGGRSLISLSSEFRIMVTDKIGVVPFVDGANVFESAYPDFNGSLQWGAGIGLRYFTSIGPLRFDVGVPLNRREGIDDPFQIYISLGQAF